MPPDVTAQIFWLKNRLPEEWREVQRIDASMGHYILSETPMDEETWIRVRASVVTDDKAIEHEPDK